MTDKASDKSNQQADAPRVLVTIQDGIAEVRLNRARKHNGLDLPMFDAILAAGEELAADRSVRVVIVFGEGPSFCAGLDFKAFMASGMAGQQKLLGAREGKLGNLAQGIAMVWTEVPVPVIAAIHGTCIGGGLQLALAADVRLAHPEARFAVREIEYGMIPDMSLSVTLRRLVRLDVAKELTYTGRDFDAAEAHALGLVTRLSAEPLAAARAMAAQIAGRSPHAIRAAKRLWTEAPELDTAAALRLETALQIPLLGSKNQMEAVQARFMGRAPVFEDPE